MHLEFDRTCSFGVGRTGGAGRLPEIRGRAEDHCRIKESFFSI
jgi:hypothetical protein